MNHWKLCLHCWIPVSKKNEKKSVVNQGEADNLDRSSSSSLDPVRQPLPVPFRRPSSAAVSYVEGSHFCTPPSLFEGNSADTSENYIPLEECFSGPRAPQQQRSLPKLVPRDIHLLDRVPPSPCSLTENAGSLSGMPEVYAPMLSRSLVRPPSLSPRLASRGADGPRRGQQATPQSAKRDLYGYAGSEFAAFKNGASASQSLRADLRNNNTCFSFKNEHGWLASGRSDPRSRVAHSSVSSEASLGETKPGCPSGAVVLHSSAPDPPECLHYRNIHDNAIDRRCVVSHQSLPLTGSECREISRRQDGATLPRMMDSGELLRAGGDLGAEGLSNSLDSKILHMTPPAPPQNNKLKAHKYVNANGSGAYRAPSEGPDSCHSTPSYSDDTGLPPTSSQSVTNDCESYYNIIPSIGQSLITESGEPLTPPPPLPPPCHGLSSSRKKAFQQRPHLPHESPHRRPSPASVALPQRARREWSKTTDDSSSSNDEEESSSGLSATNSNTSLNKPGDVSLLKSFATKPPAPSQQPRIEYLQLDLDQPSIATKGSPGPIHRSLIPTIDYIEIDPCRTKALSETKRQLESNRHSDKTAKTTH